MLNHAYCSCLFLLDLARELRAHNFLFSHSEKTTCARLERCFAPLDQGLPLASCMLGYPQEPVDSLLQRLEIGASALTRPFLRIWALFGGTGSIEELQALS